MKEIKKEIRPEKILQFGTGNFLRAFVLPAVEKMNGCGFNGSVIVSKACNNGKAFPLKEQGYSYTVLTRGKKDGKTVDESEIITCVSRTVNPYEDYREFLCLAKIPTLRFIVSNTTEAGIIYDADCRFDDAPQSSFPAKLCRFLFERFSLGLGGFIILPCELIENNGAALKDCVMRHAADWKLGEDFLHWVLKNNIFCDTLVDRIVTGHPQNEQLLTEKLGYSDPLAVAAEPFYFFAVKAPQSILKELPFESAGLAVTVAQDITPYRQRKVGILNGTHTAMAALGLLSGFKIVRDCAADNLLRSYLTKMARQEIMPTLPLKSEELEGFLSDVWERFENPFIDHKLASIGLNSAAKWNTRLMPSTTAFFKLNGTLPPLTVFAFAAHLVRCADGIELSDEPYVRDFFAGHAQATPETLSADYIDDDRLLCADSALKTAMRCETARFIAAIREFGVTAVASDILNKE